MKRLLPSSICKLTQTSTPMLLVNGAVDFATPPSALDKARPYYHNAQFVLLPEFSHVADVMETFQPKAFERLVTSYYDIGVADNGLYVYEPLSFNPSMSLTLIAKLFVSAMIIAPALLIFGIALVARYIRRRYIRKSHSIG